MALTREYYYEKYVLIDEWVENEPAEYIEQKVIKTDEVLYEASPSEDYLWFDFSSIPASRISEVNLDFAVVPDGDNGFKLELAGEHPEIPYPRDCDLAFNFETGYRYFYGYSAYRYFDHPTPVYAITDGIFTEYRTTYFDVADTRADSFTWCKWGIFEIEFDAVYRMTLREKQMYRIQERGEYIETIIAAEGAYPLDGAQDGFWWVRKAEYTLEPPELNYPEPIAEMDNTVDRFEFTIVPRKTDDPGNYQARLRVGIRSDFQIQLFSADTRNSLDGWFYYTGTTWEPFPASGVSANTKLRYEVPASIEWEFGVYFWSAQVYNQFWGYGPLAPFRSLLLLTETDDVYKLYINGIPYRVHDLKLEESSNGQIGKVDIRMTNQL